MGDKKEKKEKKQKKTEGSDDEQSEKEKKTKKEKKDKKDKKENKEKKDKKEKKEKKKKEKDSEQESDESGDENKNGTPKKGRSDNLEYNDEEAKAVIKSVKSWVEMNGGSKYKVSELFDEVRMHQLSQGFDMKLRLYIVLESLSNGSMDAKVVEEHSKAIDKFIENASMETADTLWAFDTYVHANQGSIKTFPLVLKALWDNDWINESGTLEYYNDDQGDGEPGFDEAKKAAQPFLKWLSTAESSGSGSDDDDESEDDD